jgi:copper chaperone CopZ
MAETISQRRKYTLTRPFLVVSILVLFVGCNITMAAGATRTLTLRVKGMTCEGCAMSIEKALKEADGVVDARVSYERGEARIKFDDQKITVVRLREIIKSLGYKLGRQKVTRGSWVRKSEAMPFSGLCAGCIIQAGKYEPGEGDAFKGYLGPDQTSADIGEVRARFNRDKGKVRLLLLLSPT